MSTDGETISEASNFEFAARGALLVACGTYLLTSLLLVVVTLSLAGVRGYDPVVVSSDSMAPDIRRGDLVLVQPAAEWSIGPGDVVTFPRPGLDGLVTHRVAGTEDRGLITRGDANRLNDSTPIDPADVVGVGRFVVPLTGFPLLWLSSGDWPYLFAWVVSVGVAAMALWLLSGPRGPRRDEGRSKLRRKSAPVALLAVSLMASTSCVPDSEAAFTGVTDTSGSSWTGETLEPATGLTAAGGISISLDWTATPDTYADGHRIFRSTTPGGPYIQIAEVTPRTTITFEDTPGPGTFYYVARAFYFGWQSTESNEVSATASSPGDYLALDGGSGHTCGARVDGSVWCWGRNDKGQAGNGISGNDEGIPVQVVGAGGVGLLTDAAEVVAGSSHSCSVKTDGTTWCWGLNDKGQLGDNTTADSSAPVQVVGPSGVGLLTGAATAAAGAAHACTAKTDGTVWCWGENDNGQLGDNTTTGSESPVQVVGPSGTGLLTGVAEVVAGLEHTCAVKTDGTVWCWGRNDNGQLGDNTTTGSESPVPVVGPGGSGLLTGVAPNAAGGTEHTCASKTDGTIWCWGRNDNGQLGDNTTTGSSTPVQVVGVGGKGVLTDVAQVVAGAVHSCGARTDGTMWCWGFNKGQLGDGTYTPSSSPVQVVGESGVGVLTGVTVTGAGSIHTCAARDDDTVVCWGSNDDSQHGDNTTDNHNVPVQVHGSG